MGEVYRAQDTRLGRFVAVKVLPAEVASDPDRRKRFEREARTVAALSHPHICTVFDVGRAETPSGPCDYLVMELLEGESLAQRLRRGSLPIAQLLEAGIQVASALDSAHRAGVVHRDVKPGNIVVTKAGAKLLDFGLARLRPVTVQADGESADMMEEETRGDSLTRSGQALGTYPYMAPEQLEGKPVDARADLFALGAVLYEMAAGRRAFPGASPASVAAAILTTDPPPIASLRAVVPRSLDRLVRTLLAKDPDQRVQSAHDVMLRLREIAEDGGGEIQEGSDSQPAAAAEPARASRRLRPVAAAATVLLLTVAAWLRWRPRETELLPPRLVPLTTLSGSETNPTFSPDGSQIAFAWEGEKGDNADIYLKMVGSPEIRRLTSDPAQDVAPSWSPDGRQIAFLRLRSGSPAGVWRTVPLPAAIHLVSPVGGSERRLGDFPARDSQLSWSPDGRFLAAARFASATEKDPRASGIYLVPVLGGEPRSITSPSAQTFHSDPALSRDGRHLAYASCFNFLSCQVDVVELDRDYVPVGPPRRLTRRAGWIRGLAWTRDGNSLVYGDVTAGRLFRAFILGDRPPERIELAGLGPLLQPATAASSDRLAFVQDRVGADIWRFDVGRPPRALLEATSWDLNPHLSPNGLRIAFESWRAGDGSEIWLAAVDGSTPTQLTRGPGILQGSPRWSPDGRRIAFDSQGEDGHWDIWTIDADGGSPSRLTPDPGDEQMPSWSRDGRFIYFQSDRAGTPADVWRIPATGGPEEQVTHGGGTLAYESADGKTLFFMRAGANAPLFALPLGGGPERKLLECVPAQSFAVGRGGVYHFACEAGPSGTPLYLLDPATGRDRLLGRLEKGEGGGAFTVSPDGKTILYAKLVGEGADLMMIENFR